MEIQTVYNWKYILISKLIVAVVAVVFSFVATSLDFNKAEIIFSALFLGSATMLFCLCRWDLFTYKIIDKPQG